MKLKYLLLLTLSSLTAAPMAAQQTDPTLTAAVVDQTLTLNNIHSKRRNLQEKIIAAEATVTLALDRVHAVEDKMLNYLSNASAAMTNIYQLKRCADLIGIEIPKNIRRVTDAIPGNLQGTAISLIVSDYYREIYAEMASLAPFLTQLVTSGTYNVTNNNGESERHRVNLLNASERYYIANMVESRLENINTKLFLLSYQIRTLNWYSLWQEIDPQGWCAMMEGTNRVNYVIDMWRRL